MSRRALSILGVASALALTGGLPLAAQALGTADEAKFTYLAIGTAYLSSVTDSGDGVMAYTAYRQRPAQRPNDPFTPALDSRPFYIPYEVIEERPELAPQPLPASARRFPLRLTNLGTPRWTPRAGVFAEAVFTAADASVPETLADFAHGLRRAEEAGSAFRFVLGEGRTAPTYRVVPPELLSTGVSIAVSATSDNLDYDGASSRPLPAGSVRRSGLRGAQRL